MTVGHALTIAAVVVLVVIAVLVYGLAVIVLRCARHDDDPTW